MARVGWTRGHSVLHTAFCPWDQALLVLPAMCACGRVVMYVPSASALTRGGYFVPRPGTKQYDTIQSAQYVLRSLVQAHGKQLSLIPSSSSGAASGSASAGVGSSSAAPVIKSLGKGSLLDVANEGLQSDSDVSCGGHREGGLYGTTATRTWRYESSQV